jgi:hypothetical protein
VLVAEVQLHRLYPGGPAQARFIARHGPDNEIVGGFTLTTRNGNAVPAMMAEGVRRMDEVFTTAFAAGRLARDPSLDLPAPPPLPEIAVEVEKPTAVNSATQVQIQINANDVTIYNFAMAHLRTVGGIQSATPQLINPSGTSYVLVSYQGSIAQLAGALSARGWVVEYAGSVLKLSSGSNKPPPLPAPPQAVQPQQPQQQPQPQQPRQPPPQQQPQAPRGREE